jgi:hypothetical protein
MARVKPLDPAIVDEWLSAWESDPFSDTAVSHLRSLITDPLCMIVVTLGVGREPRSLVFRRMKGMLPVPRVPPKPKYHGSVRDMFGGGLSREEALREQQKQEEALREQQKHIEKQAQMFRSMTVGAVAPVAPSVGQLWHQTGVRSQTFPKLERVLRWDGAEWVVIGLVSDSPGISKQGMQVCDFQEALAYAHRMTKWVPCDFIYTYDGSTRGNA